MQAKRPPWAFRGRVEDSVVIRGINRPNGEKKSAWRRPLEQEARHRNRGFSVSVSALVSDPARTPRAPAPAALHGVAGVLRRDKNRLTGTLSSNFAVQPE
jgi:hypothetical protein